MLDELLADRDFMRIVTAVTREVMYKQNVSPDVAYHLVLSSIGEPRTLRSVYDAWHSEAPMGRRSGLVWTIIRRRVIDMFRKDARRSGHSSFLVDTDDLEADTASISLGGSGQDSPQVQLENLETAEMVRVALSCFARQGEKQREQAALVRRYALEEATYEELSQELLCPSGALRVRVCKALRALRKHIQICHPDLVEQIPPCAPRRSV